MTIDRGKLIIFSAPSGAGKSTIINKLLNEYHLDARFSISATSRSPRGNEVDGVDYHFISRESFQEQIAAGAFVEYEEVYAGCYYGTLRSEIDRHLANGRNILLDIDVKGAMNVKKEYGHQAVTFFVMPPSLSILRQRLEGRATDEKGKIEERLSKATKEITFAPFFDYVVVNDDLEEACRTTSLILSRILKEQRHILLFPGSFNPMHLGHLGLANYVIESSDYRYDALWFLLTPTSPFKEREAMLSNDFRAKWIESLISGYPKMSLSLVEMEMPAPHYTYHTICELHRRYPNYRFSLLIGSDSLQTLSTWYRAEDLLDLVSILVYPRPSYPITSVTSEILEHVEIIEDVPLFDISASQVRKMIKSGKALPFMLGVGMYDSLYQELQERVIAADL